MSKGLSVAGDQQTPGITLSVAETGNNAILVCVCTDTMAGLSAVADWLKAKPIYFIASMTFNPVNLPSTIAMANPVQAVAITVIAEIRPVSDDLKGIIEKVNDLGSNVDNVYDAVNRLRPDFRGE